MDQIQVYCPECNQKDNIENVLTAQANQNVIYKCSHCYFTKRNIETSKG